MRPPESVTEAEKAASLSAYGDSGSLGAYEYDHFVPLELGGATNAPTNLWPEPGGSPNAKDSVEFALHDRVCSGEMSLAAAQRAIVGNWVKVARSLGVGSVGGAAPSGGLAGGGSAGGGSPSSVKPTCSLRAAYDQSYHDYNVYLNSDQPDASVTVSDGLGNSHSWHTDASGYADVYLNVGGRRPGRRVTARVGAASCSGSL